METYLYNDDIDYLVELYDLHQYGLEIAKETVKYHHAYRTVGNPDILIEGFNGIIQKMGDFFKKMIENIKEFFKKILMYIQSCFMDIDKFCKKFKKELDALDKINFDIEGFEWTMHNEPDMSEFRQVVSDYNSDLADVAKLKKEEILVRQNEFLKESNLDRIRGNVLGSNNNISSEDFVETVRKYYRNGEIDSQSIHIDTSKYRDIVSGVETLSKDKKQAEKTRDELIVLLDKAMRFFDKKASTIYQGGVKKIEAATLDLKDKDVSLGDRVYSSENSMSTIEALLRFKYVQSNKLAGIINTVACERANAYKDQVKWTRQVIRKGLFKDNFPEDEEV